MFNNANIHYNKLAKGSPFPNADNLQGAWLHNKAPQETTIVDERTGIDKSRPIHRGRALKFTGVEHITVPYQLTDGDDDFKFECEVIFDDLISQLNFIFDSRGVSNAAAVTLYADSVGLRVRSDNNGVFTSDPLSINVRYIITLEYLNGTFILNIKGDDGYEYNNTSARATGVSTSTLYLGSIYNLGNKLKGTIGWVRISKNSVPTVEYFFEENAGTTVYNRLANQYHGTINNAVIATFRVEEDRITNNDQGSGLNTFGYSEKLVFESDFSGVTPSPTFAKLNVSSSSNESILGVDDALKFTLQGGAANHYAYAAGITPGQEYRITFDYYIPSGQTLDYVRAGVGSPETTFDTTGEWVTGASFTQVASNVFYIFRFTSLAADGDVFYIKNIVVTQTDCYVPRLTDLVSTLGSDITPNSFLLMNLSGKASVINENLVLTTDSGLSRWSTTTISASTYYQIEVKASVSSGQFRIYLGGNNSSQIINSSGIFVFDMFSGSVNTWIGINPTGCSAVIESISVKEKTITGSSAANTDVLGNPLTYNKPVAIDLQLVNSNCAFYHQSGCDLTFSGFTVQDFTMVLYADLDSALQAYIGFRALYGNSSSNIYYMQSDDVYFRASGQTTNTTPWSGGSFSDEDFTGWKLFIITRDFASGTITLHVNGVSKSVLETASKGFDYTINSLGDSNNQFLAAKVAYSACYNRVLTQDEIDNWNPFNAPQTGLEVFHLHTAGNGTTVYDISGNGRHANVNGATLSTFWGSRQDNFHWNLRKGFLKGFGTSNNAYYNLDQPLENPIGKTVKFGFVYNTGGSRQWLFTTNVSGVGSFYVQLNTNGVIQIEQQGTNTVILISGSNFTDGHYYEVEFDYPATSDLQTVSTVLLNGTSVSFTTGANIYGSSGNHIGYNSSGSGFPLTDARIVFIKIGDTLYSELNNWGGATLLNNASVQYLRIPDLATENVVFAAGKWHNDAETQINAPMCPELVIANNRFTTGFWYTTIQTVFEQISTEIGANLTGGFNVVVTNGETIGGRDNTTKATLNNTVSTHILERSSIYTHGYIYRVTFDYYIPSSQTINSIVGPFDGGVGGNKTFNVLDTWTTASAIGYISDVGNVNHAKLRFYAAINGNTSAIDAENDYFAIQNVKLETLYNINDIEYADIVDNYEDADTLFADVAEDNKRMKLLQYKNPLTE